ncbi:MAG TPA: hypothetical protein VNL15_00950, partial [Dehalococcoidia bacterium]|nr:hypothetical protein [Dehalococcoidia bacterium]
MGADTAGTLMSVRPRPQVLGDEFIPVHDPFVLVANHYERPGLRVYWGGTLVSFAVSQKRQDRLHWLMTSEWRNYRLGPVPVPVWFLRWLFRRIARVYGLIIVPRAS